MKKTTLLKCLLSLAMFLLLALNLAMASAVTFENYTKLNGTTLTYRGTTTPVSFPTTYEAGDTEFRAAWVSYLIGSLSYTNESTFKSSVNKILDVLEYYNCNAVIYHVRTYNQAYYRSTLNKVDSSMASVDWNTFDPMEYVITETHKRGMEFHAWLNPYRIAKTSSYANEAAVAAAYSDYAAAGNATANVANIITADSFYQLDPGRPAVRSFLVNTCLEIIKQYDVDAIHFDDYFYFEGSDDMDAETRALYNTTGLSIANYRRLQNDTFISELSTAIRAYNTANGRYVQLGISPSGIYRNTSYSSNYTYDADGNLTSPVGSATAGFAHYDSYLYADTLKWINNEWIDYILPQTYWAIEHPIASYPAIMDWWNAAVKYKNVNLYSGIGLYMANESGSNYSWASNPNEMYNQILYQTKLENCKGSAVYSYNYMRAAYDDPTSIVGQNMTIVKEKAWSTKVILPAIRTLTSVKATVIADGVKQKTASGITLSWSNVAGAKFYYVYKDTDGTLEWTKDEIIDVVQAQDGVVTCLDAAGDDGSAYGVRTLSKTNDLSGGALISGKADWIVTWLVDGKTYATQLVADGTNATAPADPVKEGARFDGWDDDAQNITSARSINALFTMNQYTVTFKVDGTTVATQTVTHGADAVAPTDPVKEGYAFLGWDKDLTSIKADTTVNATFHKLTYLVRFYSIGELVSSETCGYGEEVTAPDGLVREGYVFKGWDKEFSSVTGNLDVYAIWEQETKTYTVRYLVDGVVWNTQVIEEGADAATPSSPTKTGYDFAGWDATATNVTSDLDINATFTVAKEDQGCFLVGISTVLPSALALAFAGLFLALRRKKEED